MAKKANWALIISLLGSGVLAGLGISSYSALAKIIDNGWISIKPSKNMPSWISKTLKEFNILPSNIKLKPIFDSALGKEVAKPEGLAKYLDVSIEVPKEEGIK